MDAELLTWTRWGAAVVAHVAEPVATILWSTVAVVAVWRLPALLRRWRPPP